jgi:GT2 family glycosyltransferase
VARDPHVSISLSAYNEGPFVVRTVNEILKGTEYPSFDIVIHDDGSKDASCENLPDDSRVALVRSESRHGVSGGKKIAIEACSGPLLLNMDCHIAPAEPGWLQRLVEVMQELDCNAILSPVAIPLDPVKWKLRFAKPRVLTQLRKTFQVSWWRILDSSKRSIEVSALRGIAKLMSRETYDAIGGFDEALGYGGEEADVSMRAWMAGFVCAYVPSSLIGHVFKSQSQFPRSYTEEATNRLRVAYKCLSEDSYTRVLNNNKEFLKNSGAWGAGVFENSIAAVKTRLEEFNSAREQVQRRSVHSGEWVLERFQIKI